MKFKLFNHSLLFVMSLFGFMLKCHLLLSAPSQPEIEKNWSEQIKLLEALEPKLKQDDRKLYEEVIKNIDTDPSQSILAIENSDEAKRSPVFDFLLGNLHLQKNAYEKAERALKSSVKKFPNFLKAHRSLANLYIAQSKLSEAKSSVLKVISLGGKDAFLYGLLAYAYYEEGKYASALSAYRMARMFDADKLDYKIGELYCLAQSGEDKKVISLSAEILEKQPKNKEIWLLQSNGYLKLEQPFKAIANLEIMNQRGLADHSALIQLAQLYYNQSLYAQSVLVYNKTLQYPKKRILNYLSPLEGLVWQQKWEVAKQLQTSLESSFTDSELNEQERWLVCKAQIQMSDKATRQAGLTSLQKIVEKWPLNGTALVLLANGLKEDGKLDDAKFYFERASGIENVQEQAWQELGRLSWADGDAAEAVKWLEKLQTLKPSSHLSETIRRLKKRI